MGVGPLLVLVSCKGVCAMISYGAWLRRVTELEQVGLCNVL